MAKAKVAVIGDKDSVMLFKAVGIDVFYETEGERANRQIKKLAREGYAVIYVTETLYPLCTDAIETFRSEPYPAIIPIPDAHGTKGTGMQNLKGYVETAVGVDILFNS
ncbi:MAG: V-type ATP synthase subunit F [Clostridia bacterium]|nr:V-type ATP synthase subunit F [Clostridia bacterium]